MGERGTTPLLSVFYWFTIDGDVLRIVLKCAPDFTDVCAKGSEKHTILNGLAKSSSKKVRVWGTCASNFQLGQDEDVLGGSGTCKREKKFDFRPNYTKIRDMGTLKSQRFWISGTYKLVCERSLWVVEKWVAYMDENMEIRLSKDIYKFLVPRLHQISNELHPWLTHCMSWYRRGCRCLNSGW